jgi:hypothetical protein
MFNPTIHLKVLAPWYSKLIAILPSVHLFFAAKHTFVTEPHSENATNQQRPTLLIHSTGISPSQDSSSTIVLHQNPLRYCELCGSGVYEDSPFSKYHRHAQNI